MQDERCKAASIGYPPLSPYYFIQNFDCVVQFPICPFTRQNNGVFFASIKNAKCQFGSGGLGAETPPTSLHPPHGREPSLPHCCCHCLFVMPGRTRITGLKFHRLPDQRNHIHPRGGEESGEMLHGTLYQARSSTKKVIRTCTPPAKD